MIDPELAVFLNGPLMTVAATPGGEGRLILARSMGLDCAASGRLDLLISRDNWAAFLDGLGVGAPVAVTAARPDTYRSYQLKGSVTEIAPASEADRDRAARYVDATRALLAGLGVPPGSVAQWLTDQGLIRVGVRVREVYEQTPGPRAGRRLAPA